MNKLNLIALLSVSAVALANGEAAAPVAPAAAQPAVAAPAVPVAAQAEGAKKEEAKGYFTQAKDQVVNQYNDVKSVLGQSYASKTRIATSVIIFAMITGIVKGAEAAYNYFTADKAEANQTPAVKAQIKSDAQMAAELAKQEAAVKAKKN